MKSYQPYGLLGKSLSHSFSKTIHQLISDHPYALIETAPEDLDDFFKQRKFKGINVTIPYKQSVFKYLDYVHPLAKEIGACNCIVQRNGQLMGYNTDIDGILHTLKLAGVSLKDKKVLILGKGGAMKAFETAARQHGAADIRIVYHSPFPGTITYQEAYENHPDAHVLINATPVGMYPDNESSPVDLSKFPKLEFVFDAVYNPQQTRLLQQANELGIPYVNGLPMLVEQARSAHQLFLDRSYPHSIDSKILMTLMAGQLNICLIGMPSSGKSTIANLLGRYFNRPVIDTDQWIESHTKKSIPEIFKEQGEQGFRKIEAEAIKRAAKVSRHIIALGGGSVLDPENVRRLQQNAVLIWLDRPLELLVDKDENRPLLAEGIENLYTQRKEIYRNSADLVIDNSGTPEQSVKKIRENLLKPELYTRFLGGIKL